MYTNVRPGVKEFIDRLSKNYEIVVFTASRFDYAGYIVDKVVDPEGYNVATLDSRHCTQSGKKLVKDLSKLGRKMEDIIIVDNSTHAYKFHPQNALPCKNWFRDKKDDELHYLGKILEKMAHEKDVRTVLKQIVPITGQVNYEKATEYLSE